MTFTEDRPINGTSMTAVQFHAVPIGSLGIEGVTVFKVARLEAEITEIMLPGVFGWQIYETGGGLLVIKHNWFYV